MRRFRSLRLLLLFFIALVGIASAESGFDLDGPALDVKVMRAGQTLPISQVPNLQPGDRIWLHPNFTDDQSAHYLLVVAFLRGSTNPPPEQWFIRAETWSRKVREEGIYVMVPQGAEQALFFLAPDTGGGFSTLKSNVRAKPGSFVRASQDLNQASLDRSRLDTYRAGIMAVSYANPDSLKDASKVLGQSLDIKVDSACFQKPADMQLACLTQSQNTAILDDQHTETMVAKVTSGDSAALIGQLSYSPAAAMYSPYVGAIVDTVRLLDGIHTAQYQYIPALSGSKADLVRLKLNNAPSFSNPKSVITSGLPAVQQPQPPPVRLVHPDDVYCLESSSLVLPVEGAPLVYSTELAHGWTLHVPTSKGASIDLPARPEANKGGFVVDTHTVEIANMDPDATGILRGYWGFDPFEGPSVHLASSRASDWILPENDKSALIVGREDTLHLQAAGAACVNKVSVEDAAGKVTPAQYKLVKPNELEVKVPLQNASPGPVTLLLAEAGMASPDHVKVQAYSEGARLDKFTLYAGDSTGKLTGLRLDEVLKMEFAGVSFSPAGLKREGNEDELTLTSLLAASHLKAGQKGTAHVLLNDGRHLDLAITIQPPRPTATLISKNIELGDPSNTSPIHLANQDVVPQDSTLSFVLKTAGTWPRSQQIEVGTADDSINTTLTLDDGTLTLQDSSTVLAALNPLKKLGPSAFGALRFRPVQGSIDGDWQPLGNLVRIPMLKDVHCPSSTDKPCSLSGSNLFLLDSVSNNPSFRNAVNVPLGFANSSINVPRPYGTLLYIKLRDDPTAMNLVSLPVLPE